MSSNVPAIPLNDGNSLPQIGLGTWQIANDAVPAIIEAAVGAGYRAIDTAAAYGNEAGVGEGIRRSGLPRAEIKVTTKLWNDGHGRDAALRAFDASLAGLGLDTVDLYLIHWPVPASGLYVETWKTLVEIAREGRARSIGVSNFTAEHLERAIEATGVVPAVNQIELHPHFQQHQLRAFHAAHGIVTQSWSPLGRGRLLDDPVLEAVARKHGRSTAQVVLRWHVENGLVVIPKSVRAARLDENMAIFDFALDAEDMAAIAALDRTDGRGGPDPATFG
ncbi:aldo/keto reductase [Ancylobacter sp. MQZ15Z-1]|uniref:Aldo/keto reductase n=1 Tax=Ancylobacter mangrovi TaxID=2972472 RepID=A0A9X2T8K3_9HYPH|nr:aldo/keto reductase [Ancylobacter mangrovi]MCS0497273.1 aldo/keto reductase [Ancylobacter mangrovi]